MKQTENYQLIIFDWDGTIVDSEAFIVSCVQLAAKDVGLISPEAKLIKSIIGLSLDMAFFKLFPEASIDIFYKFQDSYRAHYYNDRNNPTPFSGVRSCLDSLTTNGYLLAVATGKGRHGLERDLNEMDLNRYFTATRTASETLSKPDPQMLNEILIELGLDASQALMIGDTEYDLMMAQSAGVDAIGVTYGVYSKDELIKHSCLACIDDIAELPTWLNKNK